MALSLTLAAAAFAPPRSHLPLRRTRCALTMQSENREPPHNVLGGDLDCCCADVRSTGIGTGFYRDGFCSTGDDDRGRHCVCIEATADFLRFSAAVGNDLSTPFPQYSFPGLQDGDQWCLCASRWAQAYAAGMAPKVHLAATHERTLEHATLDQLLEHAVDREAAEQTIKELNALRSKLEKQLE